MWFTRACTNTATHHTHTHKVFETTKVLNNFIVLDLESMYLVNRLLMAPRSEPAARKDLGTFA